MPTHNWTRFLSIEHTDDTVYFLDATSGLLSSKRRWSDVYAHKWVGSGGGENTL